jgi:hypothetical protein
MARTIDRRPLFRGERFFIRRDGGLVLSTRRAETVRYALQNQGAILFCHARIVSTPASSQGTSRLSERSFSDHRVRLISRRVVCPAEVTGAEPAEWR